jgi:hypothetical protein
MKNILAAFKKRDAEAAAAAMHKHLEAAKHFLIMAIDQIDKERQSETSSLPGLEPFLANSLPPRGKDSGRMARCPP